MPAPQSPQNPVNLRDDRIDAVRALAMLWMTVFHFCFDLHHFGFISPQNFYTDPFWTWQRTAIVSLFLSTAGFSQAVALHTQGLWAVPWWQRLDARFWRRWAQVAGCALLVSVGSWVVFPRSFIYFGVLHGLAVMLLIARCTAGWGRGLWWSGGGVIAMYLIAKNSIISSDRLDIFNEKYLNWLGFISRKPVTEDFVPLLPWLAAVWWGMAAGFWVLHQRPHWLVGIPAASPSPGVWGWRGMAHWGRWSLSYYMWHQPVLFGVLGGVWAMQRL
jgi:uncharacterized membrane protein